RSLGGGSECGRSAGAGAPLGGGSVSGRPSRSGAAGLVELDAFRWQLPRTGAMRVPGLLFANRALLEKMLADRTLDQVRNAAELPGILDASIAMPDAHWGYG